MMMKKVSVIVPFYNSVSTLARCVQSLQKQTLKDLEIVLVDDGSSDGSEKLCNALAEKDTRIRVVHKKNRGLVAARKSGLAAATGDYIGFVDSDDYVDPEMFESLYQNAVEFGVEIVTSGYYLEGHYISTEYDTLPEGLYQKNIQVFRENNILNFSKQDVGIRASVCPKLFKKKLLETIFPGISDELTLCEDKMITLAAVLNAASAYIIHKAWYHYVINHSSMTQTGTPDYLYRMQVVRNQIRSLSSHPNFTSRMQEQADLYLVQQLLKGINSRMGLSFSNLMWINPAWQFHVPQGSKVFVVGVGALAETYSTQLQYSNRLSFSGSADFNSEKDLLQKQISNAAPDFILLGSKDRAFSDEMKSFLLEVGLPEEKILLFEQKEIFWDYAMNAGLLKVDADEIAAD